HPGEDANVLEATGRIADDAAVLACPHVRNVLCVSARLKRPHQIEERVVPFADVGKVEPGVVLHDLRGVQRRMNPAEDDRPIERGLEGGASLSHLGIMGEPGGNGDEVRVEIAYVADDAVDVERIIEPLTDVDDARFMARCAQRAGELRDADAEAERTIEIWPDELNLHAV